MNTLSDRQDSWFHVTLVLSNLLLVPFLSFAQDLSDQYQVNRGAQTFGEAVEPAIVFVDMDNQPETEPWQPGDPRIEFPRQTIVPDGWVPPDSSPRQFDLDPLVERARTGAPQDTGLETLIFSVPGNPGNGAQPPDTNGDVGLQFYLQAINGETVVVLDKTDGSLQLTLDLEVLAQGSGTSCTNLRSDPVVFFDQFANDNEGRWVITEFTPAGASSICFFISQTPDPTAGSWFIYEFSAVNPNFVPDYIKPGVWSDMYYAGANETLGGGRSNYAFDRSNMLVGATARAPQLFESPTLNGYFFQLLLPADADGNTMPPKGAPGVLLRKRDDEAHTNDGDSDDPINDFIDYWEMSIDFDDEANSTFSGPISVAITDFDADLCGLTNFNCVPQVSGPILDSVAETLMWRVQYRRFADRQIMTSSFVVDVDGNDLHGVRWFVLERPSNTTTGNWTLADEGTQSLDNINRWMSSIAMDQSGNLAMAYSVSDNVSIYPGIRYAGRLSTDTPGALPQGEFTLIDGVDSNNGGRWGDYSSMSVDPVDDCTFYFTSMYNPAANWETRVAAFRFNSCDISLEEVFYEDGFEDEKQ